MNISDFKEKLDNRRIDRYATSEEWKLAHNWASEVNKGDSLMKWSWDCGFKLDYDGDICRICSRFYPPHKSSIEYGKYHGIISVQIGDAEEYIHETEIEAATLDELQEKVENYVSKIITKIRNAIKAAFN